MSNDTPTRTEFEAAALPPLPEWSKRDDFGGIDGMLPSEVRSGLVAYARQHEQAVRQSIATEWAPVLRALQDALDIFNPEPGEKHLAPKWEARAKTAIAAAMGWPTVSEQKKPVGQFIPGFTAEETAEYWRQHAVPEVKS